MTRRNPTTTTAGGRVRETRLTTLRRRRKGVLAVAITSRADGTAGMRFAMRDGDVIDVRAPNVPTAVRAAVRYLTSAGFAGDISVNGLDLRGHEVELLEEYVDSLESNADARDVRYVAEAAANAWLALGEGSAARINDAVVRTLEETDWNDRWQRDPTYELLKALSDNRVGLVAYAEFDGGPFWRAAAAAYVETDSLGTPTLLYDVGRDRFVVTTPERWELERRRARR